MSRKQRLELTWIGKDERPRLEPRILLEDTEKSFHAPYRVTDQDIFDNRLIFGDNLLALKVLTEVVSSPCLSESARQSTLMFRQKNSVLIKPLHHRQSLLELKLPQKLILVQPFCLHPELTQQPTGLRLCLWLRPFCLCR
jgi:hypothetical protein